MLFLSNPTFLFFVLSFISIMYFIVGWYTNLFNIKLFGYKIATHTHLYFTLLYICCFFFAIFLWFVDWYAGVVAEILNMAAASIVADPNFDRIFADCPDIPTEPIDSKPADVKVDNSVQDSVTKTPEKIVTEKTTVVHTAIEKKPVPIKTLNKDFITNFFFNKVVSKAGSSVSNPKNTAVFVEVAKVLSPVHTSSSFGDVIYPARELGIVIPDIPDVTISSYSAQTTVEGEPRTAFCINPRECLKTLNDVSRETTGTPRFSWLETHIAETVLYRNDMSGDICVMAAGLTENSDSSEQ